MNYTIDLLIRVLTAWGIGAIGGLVLAVLIRYVWRGRA